MNYRDPLVSVRMGVDIRGLPMGSPAGMPYPGMSFGNPVLLKLLYKIGKPSLSLFNFDNAVIYHCDPG